MLQGSKFTINCRGRLLDLSEPCVMGILNITPDSFYDGGKYIEPSQILKQTEKMLTDGVAIIDVGAASSRPGAGIINSDDECARLIPAIELLRKNFPHSVFSIDTYNSVTAANAIEAGADMINDISAGEIDTDMFEAVARLQVPYVLMHMQGTPQNMQDNPHYDSVTEDVIKFFVKKVSSLRALHVHDIILDPGFGFGKTAQHNFQLLRFLKSFEIFDLPLMAGLSRKSMICKVLKINPDDALNGTTVLNAVALLNGAKILRVHDVKEAMQCIRLVKELNM